MDDRSSDSLTFWDHLDALRGVLIRVAVTVAILAVGAFAAMPYLFDNVVLAPCMPDFITYRILASVRSVLPSELASDSFSLNPVSLELTSQFLIHITTACWTAVVIGFPIIIYQLWGFVSPALYDHEKRGIIRAFIAGNFMFYLGAAVGYFVVFPLALRFLATYSLSDNIHAMVSLESYMDNFFTLILAMGAVFELPLLAWLLGRMGFLNRSFFSRYRRHAIVGLLILAALITPTGDPFTLFIVFLPLYALWELGALLVPRKTEN
ncbi:MAG: twin-arginine translocase subunit TatC [Muribaculaceae bacterium]|nr:twin-arginine translocase subunit TatC [Muribaculaceae bacterium]